MSALLEAVSIRKSFGRRTVLSSGHLEAHPGRVTFLAGRNGAGKTTLLEIAAGLVRPDEGTVRFAGREPSPPRLSEMAGGGLFYLPDRGILSPSFTLARHLRMVFLRMGGRPPSEVVQILELEQLLDRHPPEFSTGERRRAEVALALVRDPRCLIADEPLRGIDPKDTEVLLAVFGALASRGCAVVISGHDALDLMTIADEVTWVREGRSHSLGSPAVARLDERFRREYLEAGPLPPPPSPPRS